MNQLQLMDSVVTMSSNEIAELTGKRHKHVLADCRKLISEYEKLFINQLAEISALIKSTTYKDANNEHQPAFELSKQATLDLVTGYSLPMRHAINKRWMELEEKQKQSLQIPQTLSEALLLAGKLAAEKEAAIAKIEADKPKVEFAERVRNMVGACSVGEFAKAIGLGRNTLFKLMRGDGILMAGNLPYQRFIDDGRFLVIEQTPFTDSKGREHPAFTTYITGKGQVWLEKKYRKNQPA